MSTLLVSFLTHSVMYCVFPSWWWSSCSLIVNSLTNDWWDTLRDNEVNWMCVCLTSETEVFDHCAQDVYRVSPNDQLCNLFILLYHCTCEVFLHQTWVDLRVLTVSVYICFVAAFIHCDPTNMFLLHSQYVSQFRGWELLTCCVLKILFNPVLLRTG